MEKVVYFTGGGCVNRIGFLILGDLPFVTVNFVGGTSASIMNCKLEKLVLLFNLKGILDFMNAFKMFQVFSGDLLVSNVFCLIQYGPKQRGDAGGVV